MKKSIILTALVFISCSLFYFLDSPNKVTVSKMTVQASRISAFPDDYEKRRVIVSTDIGGGDFDDVQSMIHYALYMDMFDTEAIISSMPRPGDRYWREIVKAYRKDYRNLSFYSADYPTPREFKKLYVAGSTSKFPGNSNRGARAIIKAVKKDDPRPVYVLIWGAGTDLAIALRRLRNKPKLYSKIRPVLILNSRKPLGFNGLGDEGAWEYIMDFPIKKLAFDSMIRGIYATGVNSKKKYGNVGFVEKVLKPRGRLGRLFHARSAFIDVNRFGIKMGDTPSVFFVMNGDWDKPKRQSWAGRFCKVNRFLWEGCRTNPIGRWPAAGWIANQRRAYMKDFERRAKRLDPVDLSSVPEVSPTP